MVPAHSQQTHTIPAMMLHDVNTTDIAAAIRLGCRTMSSVFNADDNDIPFFASRVLPTAELNFNTFHSESHVPGRHLNALLNAEEVLGVRALQLDEAVIEKHARAAFFSYGGALPLPLNRLTVDGPLVHFLPHNIREGFHALYALVKFRNSAHARELAEASIEAIFKLWKPDTGWNREVIEGELGLKMLEFGGHFITGIARAMGPLVKYYKATGYGPALKLALLLKEEAIRTYFTVEGNYSSEFGTHTHSTTCTMSSLAQLADLTQDMPLMSRVKAFYDNGLWAIRDELGWVIENSDATANPDRGEVNNTGDLLETALLLGKWGYIDCYQDAERILRGHLLPSQLRDVSFIQEPPNPEAKDGRRNMAQRHLGAFGFPAPYGHRPIDADEVSFNMDIVGGAVGSLCEAYRNVAVLDEAGLHVNLFFDIDTSTVKIESPYPDGALQITPKQTSPMWLRAPAWAGADLHIEGAQETLVLSSGQIFIPTCAAGQTIRVKFDLPLQPLALKHRTRTIKATLRGDQTIAMDSFGAPLTFFEPSHTFETSAGAATVGHPAME